jgi:hypothetical protein
MTMRAKARVLSDEYLAPTQYVKCISVGMISVWKYFCVISPQEELVVSWVVKAWVLSNSLIFCLCNHSLCDMGRSGSGLAIRD